MFWVQAFQHRRCIFLWVALERKHTTKKLSVAVCWLFYCCSFFFFFPWLSDFPGKSVVPGKNIGLLQGFPPINGKDLFWKTVASECSWSKKKEFISVPCFEAFQHYLVYILNRKSPFSNVTLYLHTDGCIGDQKCQVFPRTIYWCLKYIRDWGVFCPAVCSTERHCCPEPRRLKRLNALLLPLLAGRRGWKCDEAAPVVFFVLICCCSGGFFVQGCLSVIWPQLRAADRLVCVSGWLLLQPLLWYSCGVTFCRAECCGVFWILYIFSNFNVKTQPGCYFWPEAETARRGTLSCSGLWGLLVTVLYSGCEHYSSNWVLGKGISDICSMVEGVTVLLFWFCWVFFVCLGFFWRGVYLLFFWLYFSLLTWSFSSNSKDVEMVLLFVTCRVWKTWLDFLFSYFFCRLFYLLWVF